MFIGSLEVNPKLDCFLLPPKIISLSKKCILLKVTKRKKGKGETCFEKWKQSAKFKGKQFTLKQQKKNNKDKACEVVLSLICIC